MALTAREFQIMDGLHACTRTYIAASEAVDVLPLIDRKLIFTWQTSGGFSAMRLTTDGEAELAAERERLRA